MKVVFFDKQGSVLFSILNVDQVQCVHNGKYKEWLIVKDGYVDKYKCSRFEVERIENEE